MSDKPTRFSMWCAATHGHLPTASPDGNYVTYQEYERDITAEKQRSERLEKALRGLRRDRHDECEDSWYSCPKSEDGCSDDRQTGCTCGTDYWNERIDAALGDSNG